MEVSQKQEEVEEEEEEGEEAPAPTAPIVQEEEDKTLVAEGGEDNEIAQLTTPSDNELVESQPTQGRLSSLAGESSSTKANMSPISQANTPQPRVETPLIVTSSSIASKSPSPVPSPVPVEMVEHAGRSLPSSSPLPPHVSPIPSEASQAQQEVMRDQASLQV